MSNGENEEMSFEDALKKIVNTKVDPALFIEELGKRYQFPHVNGKWLHFAQVNINGQNVEKFIVRIHLLDVPPKEEDRKESDIDLYPQEDKTAFLEGVGFIREEEGKNPMWISKSTLVYASIVPKGENKSEEFEGGYITYKGVSKA